MSAKWQPFCSGLMCSQQNGRLILLVLKLEYSVRINTLSPRQNGHHFAYDVFKCIFLNENVWSLIKISFNFVPMGPINNIPALVQIMAWRLPGDKPLSEPMMVRLLTHICVTQPQWVKPDRKLINSREDLLNLAAFLALENKILQCVWVPFHKCLMGLSFKFYRIILSSLWFLLPHQIKAVLLWPVQNCDLIRSLFCTWEQHISTQDFELGAHKPLGQCVTMYPITLSKPLPLSEWSGTNQWTQYKLPINL